MGRHFSSSNRNRKSAKYRTLDSVHKPSVMSEAVPAGSLTIPISVSDNDEGWKPERRVGPKVGPLSQTCRNQRVCVPREIVVDDFRGKRTSPGLHFPESL